MLLYLSVAMVERLLINPDKRRPRVWFRCFFSLLTTIAPIIYLGIAGCDRITHSSASSVPAPLPAPAPPRLIEATLTGQVETVRSLLQTGTDPNFVYHTNTALTYAARDGFTDIARWLIEYGADVNWIDGEGVTPLILASFKGHIELVQLLLDHGADTTVRDQWNRTALDYALRRGESDPIVQLLQMSRYGCGVRVWAASAIKN